MAGEVIEKEMEMNYTKEKWEADFTQMTGHCGIAINAGDKQVANVYLCHYSSDWEDNPIDHPENAEAKANVHLMKAAPKMYEALRLYQSHQQGTSGHYCWQCAEAIEQALAEAEGRGE